MKKLFRDGRQIWEVKPCKVTNKPSDILTDQHPLTNKNSQNYSVNSIKKYWARRYSFWPNFDSGICTDAVGLFSVTPWDSAVQIAQTLDSYYPNDSPIIIDACCGVGGNTVAFSRCISGANIIGVDAINFVSSLRGSARFVFSSPPWGGPGYSIETLQDIPFDVFSLMEASIKGCVGNNGRLALFLPRNFPVKEAKKLARKGTKMSKFDVTSGPNNRIIATCFLYGKLKNST